MRNRTFVLTLMFSLLIVSSSSVFGMEGWFGSVSTAAKGWLKAAREEVDGRIASFKEVLAQFPGNSDCKQALGKIDQFIHSYAKKGINNEGEKREFQCKFKSELENVTESMNLTEKSFFIKTLFFQFYSILMEEKEKLEKLQKILQGKIQGLLPNRFTLVLLVLSVCIQFFSGSCLGTFCFILSSAILIVVNKFAPLIFSTNSRKDYLTLVENMMKILREESLAADALRSE